MTVDAERAKSVFLTASELADLVERAAYLDRECGDDAELRARVEALLKANDESPLAPLGETVVSGADFERESADSFASTTNYHPRIEADLMIADRYTLKEKIGEGGMGEVWVARQSEPVKRKVALKLIKTGMDSKVVLARFEQERQALAMMDHPNIARVLDGGITATGQPFFVMELVNGLPLNQFCDEAKLPLAERLELFIPICQAVQHAHQKGVVHRDLKPANILVTIVDGRPIPKVIDFGVAKATFGKLTDQSLSTQFGAIVGTLEYMPPEQAGFGGEDIDTRADIYSLGVILYELLTGLRPIDATRLKQAAFTEMIRIIREEEPSKPSARLSTDASLPTLAAVRKIEPKKLMAQLRGELDWIVMKCLEKQRNRRYETASGLCRDIQRYLANEPVEARSPSVVYRAKKFMRRNPLQLTLATMFVVMLLSGVSLGWWETHQAGLRRETDLRRQLEDEQRASIEAARLARNAEAVAALLGKCSEALKNGDAPEAQLALETARKRSLDGGATEHAVWLEQLASDLTLLHDLDAYNKFLWTPDNNSSLPNANSKVTTIKEALKRYGLDLAAMPVDSVTARIDKSILRERIVSVLDELLWLAKPARVFAVLRELDHDEYRNAVRDAIYVGDGQKLEQLADQDDALKQPPLFVAFLGARKEIPLERRRLLLQTAVVRWPGNQNLLLKLANLYGKKSTDADQIRWIQAALAAAPNSHVAHTNMGGMLNARGEEEMAIAYWHRALELSHGQDKYAHSRLGFSMSKKGQKKEALNHWRKAIEIDPNYAEPYYNFGVYEQNAGNKDAAIANFRKAIQLEPENANAHHGLGGQLLEKGELDEAIDCLRRATELDPKLASAHNVLGFAMMDSGKLDSAVDCFRKASELEPTYKNLTPLGQCLLQLNRYAEASAALKQAQAALPLPDSLRPIVAQMLLQCERMLELEERLPRLLNGEEQVISPEESLEFALLCHRSRRYAAAARFSVEAFAADPKLADNLNDWYRYSAACSAAMAASGQGIDATSLDDKARAKLRDQALEWLTADLTATGKLLESGAPENQRLVENKLSHWQKDPDLNGLREPMALAKLPQGEQKAFNQLWADVVALLKKTKEQPPKSTPIPLQKE